MTTVFPANPSIGDIYNNYKWNGTAWKFVGYEKVNTYAPKDSPEITGIASLPSTTTIGVVTKSEIEKLYGITGQLATTDYVQDQIATTVAGLTGSSVTFTYPTIDTPTGVISAFAGLAAPFGYLLCDGSAVSRTAYSALFAVIGTTYGVGNGSTTFNVPNLKGKVAFGVDAAQTEFDTIAKTGGAKTHQHASGTSGNGGTHYHTTADHVHTTTDHSHGMDHYHSVNPGSTATTSDSHSHNTGGPSGNNAAGGNGGNLVPNQGHTHAVSSDSHSHTVNIATFNSSYASSVSASWNSTGGASTGNTTNGAANTSADTTAVGKGNQTTTQADHTHSVPASDTLSNLNPYIALNYIIKY